MIPNLHDLLFKTISQAPIFDWMNVGVDVPTVFFEGLIAEGMKEPYPDRRPRNGQILFSECPVWIIDKGRTGALVVHCQNLDIHTHQFTAHQQMTLAARATP